MRPPINYLPIHPRKWRKLMSRLIEQHTKKKIAQYLKISISELEERLKEDDKRDKETYEKGILKCIKSNPRYTEQEIREACNHEIT